LPEEFSAFLIDLGPLDVLLCAGDFYGATSEPDTGPTLLNGGLFIAKGKAHGILLLEPILEHFFAPDAPVAGVAPTAFLMNSANGSAFACIVDRSFEMVSLPLKELRLLPAGLRHGRPGRSIMAVRFAGENRLQYLLDLKAMAEGGSTT
jgi:hypothetical protein